MPNDSSQKVKLALLIGGSIIILIVLSAFFGLTVKQDEMIRLYAQHSASSYFDSILLTRRWSANYGGVYVEKKDGVKSNPYLENPDIRTDDGHVFTLKNPALMTREISQLFAKTSGNQYHITSLKPLNPENAPDAWEKDALLRLEKGEKEAKQIIEKNGKSVYRLMRPLLYEQGCVKCHSKQGYNIGDVRGGVSVTLPYDEISAGLKLNRFKMLVLASGILVFLGITFYIVIWKLVERLSNTRTQLEDEKRKLEFLNSELDRRIEDRTRELADTNEHLRAEMLERERDHKALLASEEQLRQAQKMEAIGQLAGGIAHDFNNKLCVILGCAYMASVNPDPVKVRNSMEMIRKAGEQSADLTRQLLAFARKQTIAPQVMDLNEIVTGMLKMLSRLIGEHIPLIWHPTPDLNLINFDPSQIDQILANLCINARDSITDNGKITIETGNCTLDDKFCADNAGAFPGEYVQLVVSDNGCGMDSNTLNHIFEPFFTTKEKGKGTGLGLATVFGIVKQNNGFISVQSEPGIGTTFSIYLAQHVNNTSQIVHESAAPPITGGSETILLVEDEADILMVLAQFLESQGYTVLPADTPAKAILLAKEHAGEIKLLITDVIMPEMNGMELANSLGDLCPHIQNLFISGYIADTIAQHGVLEEGIYFMQKPLSLLEVANKVRFVLDKIESRSSVELT